MVGILLTSILILLIFSGALRRLFPGAEYDSASSNTYTIPAPSSFVNGYPRVFSLFIPAAAIDSAPAGMLSWVQKIPLREQKQKGSLIFMERSKHILEGLGNQYYRATLKSMGFTTDDLKRPIIGHCQCLE